MSESTVGTQQTVGWYYTQQGQQRGPVNSAALRQAISLGNLHVQELVWREGLPAWVPIHSVPDLMPPGTPPPLGYYAPTQNSPDIGQDAGMRLLLPVGRSGWAIAAGYLGLFSVLILPAPIAVIISIIAIIDIKNHPKRHGMGRAIFGLVMGVICSIGFVAMIVFRK